MHWVHMTGAGNEFVVIDARNQTLDLAALAKSLCAQVCADGFMAIDTSEVADFRLHFYNADGTRADMCGNGSRCICRFAYDWGVAREQMTVETDAGIVYGWRISEKIYRVRLTEPKLIHLDRKPGVDYVECGVPHALKPLPDLSWQQKDALRQQAVALRYDPAFPAGANVTFYDLLAEGEVRVLSYERGVEDYTLACGTGCGSLAVALYAAGKLPGKKLTAHNMGGTLQVDIEADGANITGVYLQGPAEYLSNK